MGNSSARQWLALLFSTIVSITALPAGAVQVPSNIDGALATIYRDYLRSQSTSVPQQIADDSLTEEANAYR